MKNKIKITTIFLIIIILLTNAAGCTGSNEENLEIRVGGKNFTEQYIMAEMFSILIEENTDLNTTLQTNLASTVLFEAIKADEVDLYLEYTGTGLINLGMEPLTDPDEVYKIVKTEYDKQFNIRWMQPYGFNNSYEEMVSRAENSESLGYYCPLWYLCYTNLDMENAGAIVPPQVNNNVAPS
jgi:glycine betaine/choline ABC-type transport system substrate-binding protein